jgi:hypothetical protein
VDILKNNIEKLHQQDCSKNIWKNSLFENINNFKCDLVGKIGEKIIYEFCMNNDIEVVYCEDKISIDGIYDLLIYGKKVEIKTSRYGKNKTFQHANRSLNPNIIY